MKALIAALATLGAFSMTACDAGDGPVEDAAEEIDETVDEIEDTVDDNQNQ